MGFKYCSKKVTPESLNTACNSFQCLGFFFLNRIFYSDVELTSPHMHSTRTLTYLCESRALHVFDSSELTGQLLPTLGIKRTLLILCQLLDRVAVFPQVHLSAHQQKRCARAVVGNLRNPLKGNDKKKMLKTKDQ